VGESAGLELNGNRGKKYRVSLKMMEEEVDWLAGIVSAWMTPSVDPRR
jgi:hypothetical protein